MAIDSTTADALRRVTSALRDGVRFGLWERPPSVHDVKRLVETVAAMQEATQTKVEPDPDVERAREAHQHGAVSMPLTKGVLRAYDRLAAAYEIADSDRRRLLVFTGDPMDMDSEAQPLSDDQRLRLVYAERDRARTECEELRKQLSDYEEREARCCPEDVRFDEVIAALRAQVGRFRVALRIMADATISNDRARRQARRRAAYEELKDSDRTLNLDHEHAAL